VGLIPDEVIVFFNCLNPFSHTMALGSTHPLTEMSSKNLPVSKEQQACKADYFTAISELIV
jgi:hypothetical protein